MENQDINPEENQPGYLDPLFGNIEPALPPGSWERLQARRTKRRPVGLWVALPLLMLLLGAGAWWATEKENNKTAKVEARRTGKGEIARAQNIEKSNTPSSSQTKAVGHGLAKTEQGNRQTLEQKQGQSNVSSGKPAVDKPAVGKPVMDNLKKSATETKLAKAPKTPLAIAASKEAASYKNDVELRGARNGKLVGNTDGKVTAENASFVAQQKKRRTSQTRHKNKKNQVASNSGRKAYSTYTNAGTQKADRKDEESALSQTQRYMRKSPIMETAVTSTSTTKAQPLKSIIEQDAASKGLGQNANPLPMEADRADRADRAETGAKPLARQDSIAKEAAVLVKQDSTEKPKEQEKVKWKVQWQLGGVAQYFGANAIAGAPSLEGKAAATTAAGQQQTFGLQLAGGPIIQVLGSFSLQPTVGLGLLRQATNLASTPGTAANMKIVQQADGSFAGVPVDALAGGTTTATATRILLLAQAELAAHLRLTPSLSAQLGAQYVFAFGIASTGPAGQSPKPRQPQLSFGLQYAISKKLGFVAELRRLQLSQGGLPGVERSNSTLLGVGFGLGYTW